MVSIFSFRLSSSPYRSLKSALPLVASATTSFASSMPPSPPLANTSESATFTPCAAQWLRMASSSSGVSCAKALMATTRGKPYCLMFSICFSRLTMPRFTASTSGVASSVFGTPPCILSARTVATSTTASGFKPA